MEDKLFIYNKFDNYGEDYFEIHSYKYRHRKENSLLFITRDQDLAKRIVLGYNVQIDIRELLNVLKRVIIEKEPGESGIEFSKTTKVSIKDIDMAVFKYNNGL